MPFVADGKGEPRLGLRERKKQRTRAMLLDAAIDLCRRQGFERTTVDQIAAVADVSPRTFSRYFATKEAIAFALIEEALDVAAVELAAQPADINHLEAMHRAYLGMCTSAKSGGSGGLSAHRLLGSMRIIMTSPTLRQAATDYRPNALNIELAKRMGVGADARALQLVASVWGSITMTALADLTDNDLDWDQIGLDDIITRLEDTYAAFTSLMSEVVQLV
ncbi:TetR family transcriptional regulator [Mycolicibacterium holsaticum]|jgi:AcrR family transcriptional regulator|uniref:TetR family transcriptional regulator n=1 Tax=Mycolicibacterium holsaticum TaxID=152142 RepID=UPI001C7CF85F|nr:TetR family transcriptional regulator [Mycolicibacterium holsaticum]MDA4106265.1 TetR family transcriptional regulator [Mycolicibacterium holsaticum DSM 44478 = JCM 12374]QZA13420.1 TetR/AcrR family transcriptional regulator [Mycolicibacterium holsaticum DSM 44478 = JCM 12374]UNC09115.1 TetR family transcriptional regulator [Mycolicibacterium holsaticum DSM 44478 = JCM 12374]